MTKLFAIKCPRDKLRLGKNLDFALFIALKHLIWYKNMMYGPY